jgi:nucleoside triphosphatase
MEKITRVIVCPIISNKKGEYLLCKMAKDRGVFPGQWALPGGGIEKGEDMISALKREMAEELGEKLKISKITPWTFRDDLREKLFADGSKKCVYMIYCLFDCISENSEIILNDEFDEFVWVNPKDIGSYDLNAATKTTFMQKGILDIK